MAEEPAITIEGVKKSYKNVPVLKGVSLQVPRGSIYALLGSNGAGKTTTINILSTLLLADAGTACVCGFDVMRQAEKVRANISLTGQFAAVDDILTGRENLVMFAQLRRLPKPARVANSLLDSFGLQDAADRRVATYSGGMRRRLDIALSLVGEPPVIFLDEPTTGLDPQSRSAMWKTIRALRDKGTTIFLTTQYLDEADRLADEIAILHEGKIVVTGTPAELKRQLPGGQMELKLRSGDELARAQTLLKHYQTGAASGALVVATDGSANQAMDILQTLKRAGLQVTEFSQKLPSLDDVFLDIVSGKPAKKEEQ
ncbi:MAG TPA: ATP-binding cassette domain-containing protein [Candidatus Saccharimonadales bacterium]|nr:ATP-binding cassette domain-containing protein [Candidatus Saccharimonadales bacterium]